MNNKKNRFSSRLCTLCCAGIVLTACTDDVEQQTPAPVVATEIKETSADLPRKGEIKYSPYAEKKYPTQVFFGDTHHHTANSGDAFMGSNRLDPEQSYRFARGEEVISSTGVPVKLSRPMDFLVISDHAEGLGVMYEVYDGNPVFLKWAS